MEDLASMCERQCRKASNLRSAAEELEETGNNGREMALQKPQRVVDSLLHLVEDMS